MAKTAGGGLTYVLGQLVAGFLTFLAGATMAGMIMGFSTFEFVKNLVILR